MFLVCLSDKSRINFFNVHVCVGQCDDACLTLSAMIGQMWICSQNWVEV